MMGKTGGRRFRFTGVLLLLLLLSAAVAADAARGHYKKYKDPRQPIAKRVNDLMRRMTLEEKIGQMTQIERSVATHNLLNKHSIGSILSGGGSAPAPHASPHTWIHMVNAFQRSALSQRLGIPLFYGTDAVHGNNNAFNATIFPHNIALGATRDPELVKRIGAATAREIRATGIQYAFAPSIAVCRDPRWGRCYESYSESPRVVRSMTEIISGLQGQIPSNSTKGVPYLGGRDKVIACAKHYVGDGGTVRGINEYNTIASWNQLRRIHLPAYYDAIVKGVSSVMASYSSWNGVKMHANRALITGHLKNTMGFKGFVISDWQGIDKITTPPHADYRYSIRTAINAGIDMVMVPYHYTEFIDGLKDQVVSKLVPMSRINDAVRRILRVKFTMGLFEHPFADHSMAKHLGSQEHREIAREAVRKSQVLLKNGNKVDEPLLPLPKKAPKILVAGPTRTTSATNAAAGRSTGMGGAATSQLAPLFCPPCANTVHPGTVVTYRRDPRPEYVKSENFSYAVVVVGEYPYSETLGATLVWNSTLRGRVLWNVCSSVKCVVVLITGRPVVIEPYLEGIDALVAGWLPGSEGQGVADVLFGDYGFTGKLPITWFKNVRQLPMNVGDPHYDPLFPFGHGLTTQAAAAALH